MALALALPRKSNHPAVGQIRNVKEAWQEDLMDQFVGSIRRANRTKSQMESETKVGIECCVAGWIIKEFLVMPKHPYVRSIRKRREVVIVVVAVLWHRLSEKVVPRLWGILFRASAFDAKTCGFPLWDWSSTRGTDFRNF
jgi:hypothetical protein